MTYQLEAVRKNILFKFTEEIATGRFINSTKSGLIASSKDLSQNVPRWGKVTHVGPNVSAEIKVDDYILIESGMWTPGFYVSKERFWKTDEDKILATSDEPTSTY